MGWRCRGRDRNVPGAPGPAARPPVCRAARNHFRSGAARGDSRPPGNNSPSHPTDWSVAKDFGTKFGRVAFRSSGGPAKVLRTAGSTSFVPIPKDTHKPPSARAGVIFLRQGCHCLLVREGGGHFFRHGVIFCSSSRAGAFLSTVRSLLDSNRDERRIGREVVACFVAGWTIL